MTDDTTRELNGLHGLHRRQKRRWWIALAAVAAALALGGGGGYVLASDRQQQERRAEQEQGARQEAETAVEALCAQVEQLGRRCVVEPEELTGDPIPPTEEQLRPLVAEYVDEWLSRNPPENGRDAPTLAELSAVIVDEIAAELQRNPPPAGPPGDPPTPEQLRPIVVDVVAAHLLATPPPPGEDGQDGEDGADSTVPGPPGEPPLEWTFTTTDVLGRETTHRCVRDEPFDPDAPRYTCEAVDEE